MSQPFRFVLFSAIISQLWISCGDNANKTTPASADSTAVTVDTVSTQMTTPQSTIDTTPQNMVIVRYHVSNYAKWRPLYDTRDSLRSANGIHNYVIGRGVQDTNALVVVLKTDDVAKAKAFTKSMPLKSALQKGYVIGTPEYIFTSVLYQDLSPNIPDLRSMTFFTVKDWAAWRKSFEANKQTRTDNGLTARAYGHYVDDDHKVVLVVAINDSTKAEAYWNSDLIKKRRAESGVVGPVKRFVYRIVQKY